MKKQFYSFVIAISLMVFAPLVMADTPVSYSSGVDTYQGHAIDVSTGDGIVSTDAITMSTNNSVGNTTGDYDPLKNFYSYQRPNKAGKSIDNAVVASRQANPHAGVTTA